MRCLHFLDNDVICRVQVMLIASMMVVETLRITKVQQGAIQRQSFITAQCRTWHADKPAQADRARTRMEVLDGAVAVSVQRDRVHLEHTVAMGGEEAQETGPRPASLASMGPFPQKRQPLVRARQDTRSLTTNLRADPVLIPKRTCVSP